MITLIGIIPIEHIYADWCRLSITPIGAIGTPIESTSVEIAPTDIMSIGQ